MRTKLGIFGLSVAALCASLALACNKASDKDKVGTTETTSAEIEPAAPTPAPKDDYLATVRREQLVLRGRLEEEIRAIDHQLTQLRRSPKANATAIEALVERKQTLEADANVVDRADERGWDELKATVEHDLEGPPEP
ncbi:MAG: hypothetical protein KIT84_17450 [Labilithrix sp.]|nr:hypothetical protein [Labilithrix sp.]MCW5812818.1 hypothetical protein [Labilithrix sp.]